MFSLHCSDVGRYVLFFQFVVFFALLLFSKKMMMHGGVGVVVRWAVPAVVEGNSVHTFMTALLINTLHTIMDSP